MTSARKPGRNLSILSRVADHKVRCVSFLWSSAAGGTKIWAAFMTKITFLSDSGTASYCPKVSESHWKQTLCTHQMVFLIDIHQSVEQVQDLYPEKPDVNLGPIIANLEMHEGFAQ
jgi:hypothetical protein